jgi:predicted nucleotidyltransferase
MPSTITDERLAAILAALRRELDRALGHQLAQVVLFGSRARGDARPDSDIDVLIVVRGAVDHADLMRRTSEPVARVSLDNDVVVARVFASQSQYQTGQSAFLRNVRREGVPVA